MSNNNRGGGQRRQQPQQQQQPQQDQREQQRAPMTLADRLSYVLTSLHSRKDEISAVLPVDLPFDRFAATVNQALRNNPSILDCNGASIVNACVKSAYDGLRLDGREAALVAHSVKVSRRGEPDRWEQHAQYFPMVFGLIQQILRGGEIQMIETDVIYQNDQHLIQRGLNPMLEHVPKLDGERGPPIAVYAVAVWRNGYRSFLVMTRAEVEDVQKESKTGWKDGKPAGVWARWWSEMWKKTVVRRFRKTLPIPRDIMDSEAREEFPQFDRLADNSGLPAAAATPEKPVRGALAHHEGGAGVQMDFGGQDDRDFAMAGDDRDDGVVEHQPREQQKSAAPVEPAKGEQPIPEDPEGWASWERETIALIKAMKTADAVNEAYRDLAPFLKAAPMATRDKIDEMLMDVAADFAAGQDTAQ